MTTTMELLEQGMGLLLQLEEEGGELTEEFVALLDTYIDGCADKLTGIHYVRLQTKTQVEMLRDEEKRLANRRRALEKAIKQLDGKAMDLLKQNEAFGEEPKRKTSLFTVWLQSYKSVALREGCTIEQVPERFRVPQEDKLDKAEAKKVMADGTGIHGLEVVVSEVLRWG